MPSSFTRSHTEGELTRNDTNPSSSSLPVHCGKRHLPQPRGPHSVGFADVMTPGEEGVFVRLLYPTDEQCLEEHERWPQWLEDDYITAMLGFVQVKICCAFFK